MKRARETHVAIRAGKRKLNRICADGSAVPEFTAKTLWAAVKGVAIVISRNLIRLAVKAKGAFGDTVAVASNDGTEEILGIGDVLGDVVIAEHNVYAVPIAVRGLDADDAGAVLYDLHLKIMALQE